jgi:hypothetical protein
MKQARVDHCASHKSRDVPFLTKPSVAPANCGWPRRLQTGLQRPLRQEIEGFGELQLIQRGLTMAKAKTDEGTAMASDRAKARAQQASVTNNDVARRAYDLYLARGCEDGHDVDDWIQAERELRASSGTA